MHRDMKIIGNLIFETVVCKTTNGIHLLVTGNNTEVTNNLHYD